jgi:transposase-like protein
MPAAFEPAGKVKCTYKDCDLWFDTDKAMRGHKRYSDEHDYCHRCDEDFDSFEDYALHKITRPDVHNKVHRYTEQTLLSNANYTVIGLPRVRR